MMNQAAQFLIPFAIVMFGWAAHSADTGPLHDGNIAEIVETANEGEIDAAQLAQRRAQSEDVKAFAKKMEDAHKQNKKDLKDLTKKQKIDLDDHAASEALEDKVEAKIDSIKNLKGTDFDKAYMASQVEIHQDLLKDLDSNLLPNVKNAALKTHLEKTRTHVATHLEEAKRIQAKE